MQKKYEKQHCLRALEETGILNRTKSNNLKSTHNLKSQKELSSKSFTQQYMKYLTGNSCKTMLACRKSQKFNILKQHHFRRKNNQHIKQFSMNQSMFDFVIWEHPIQATLVPSFIKFSKLIYVFNRNKCKCLIFQWKEF